MIDFTDPAKKRAYTIRLFIGYFLVAVAIGLVTLILVYRTGGYNYDQKTHSIVQNGLLFLNAKPDQAAITINGALRHEKTDVRLDLPEGSYAVKLTRSGYRPWQRDVSVIGGAVQRYDYPLLFPEKIATTEAQVYASVPTFAAQSPDRRWLVTQIAGDLATFNIRDLNTVTSVPIDIKVPAELYSFTGGTLTLVAWGSDNQHFLLKHTDGTKTEFVVIDRSAPAESLNVNTILGINPAQIVVRDGHWDRIYTYDTEGGVVRSADLKARVISAPILTNVLAFKPQGADTLLYITSFNAPAGKVYAKLYNKDKTLILRELSVSTTGTYFLETAKYDSHNYYVVASPAEDKTQVFRDPLSREVRTVSPYVTPYTVLRIASPNAVTVAHGGRFIATQNADAFATFDLETAQTYRYTLSDTLAGDMKATWLDNYRLMIRTDQGVKVLDYDGTNQQQLVTADATLPVVLDKDSENLYSFTATPQAARYALQRSVLRLVNQ